MIAQLQADAGAARLEQDAGAALGEGTATGMVIVWSRTWCVVMPTPGPNLIAVGAA